MTVWPETSSTPQLFTANSYDVFQQLHKSWSMSLRSINCFQQGNSPCSSSLLLGKFLLCVQVALISLECPRKPSCNQNFTCARCKQSFGQCRLSGTSVETVDIAQFQRSICMNSWMLPLSIPTEFLPVNNYSMKHDCPNFSPGLVNDDWLTPSTDPTSMLQVVTVDIAPNEEHDNDEEDEDVKRLTKSWLTVNLGLVLSALLVVQRRLAHGRYVHDLWTKCVVPPVYFQGHWISTYATLASKTAALGHRTKLGEGKSTAQ